MTGSPQPKPDSDSLVFGKVFSDHMLLVDWTHNGGWETPKIVPYGNLSLSPALSALHYSTEVRERERERKGERERERGRGKKGERAGEREGRKYIVL